MRIPGRWLRAASVSLAAAATLAACTSATPSSSPRSVSPSPTPSPIFTSDADALAAATKTYKHFEAVADEVGRRAWADPSPLRPLLSDAGYQHELETARKYRAEGAHAVGATVVTNIVLQQRTEDLRGATVRIYVCEDLSSVDIRNEVGDSLVDAGRSDFVAYVAELAGRTADSLVIKSLGYWSGRGVCEA